jgi:hypothetical protein
MKTGHKPNLTNLLGTYMQAIPGAEVVMITNPDLLITGDIAPLLAYVDGLRMEMAWGCHLDANGKPVAFILSSQVVAHLLNDIPQSMTFADDWKGWVHAWMQRLLRHRYFDATSYAIVTPIPAQVEAVSVPTVFVENPEAHPVKVSHAKPKRGNVRRVKVA